MQKLISLLQSAKLVSSTEDVYVEELCIKKALQLIEDSTIDTGVIVQLSVNLECCLTNLDSIGDYESRHFTEMADECLVTYNKLLDECIELVNTPVPSDLMPKMQRLLSIIYNAKMVTIDQAKYGEDSYIKDAQKLLKTIEAPQILIEKLTENLEYCQRNYDGIQVSYCRNQEDIMELSYNTYIELIANCIELLTTNSTQFNIKDIPSDLIFKLLKESVDHINRLETGYAHFDQTKLNEMFVDSVKNIIEEMAQKSQEMAEFIAEDYTANMKAEKYGRD